MKPLNLVKDKIIANCENKDTFSIRILNKSNEETYSLGVAELACFSTLDKKSILFFNAGTSTTWVNSSL